VRTRFLLTIVAAALTLLVAAPAEAGPTGTPAERAREIATALRKDPLYIDPAYKTALPANLQADVRAKAKALGYPVYTMVLPLTPSDEFQGEESTVLTLVMDALRQPGLYVVVDGGSRFPWYEVRDVSQVSEEKLQAARKRALDDEGYDAGPTEVLARMYELLAQPGIPKTSQRPGSSTPSRRDYGEPGGHGWIVAVSIVGGLVVLIGLGLVIGRTRGSGPGRQKTFHIPPHVAATVAAERRRRLTRETDAELTALGSELAALPTTEGAGLAHQQAANVLGIRVFGRVHRAQVANTRRADFGGCKTLAESHSRGFHEAAVRRHADGQFDGALGATGFGSIDRPQHRRLLSGDDDLSRRIEIHGFHHGALRGLGTGRFDLRIVET